VRIVSDSAPAADGDTTASEPDEASALTGLSLQVVSSLLTGLGSTLKSVRSPAGCAEHYFEIEQRVLAPAPIGKLTVEDAGV